MTNHSRDTRRGSQRAAEGQTVGQPFVASGEEAFSAGLRRWWLLDDDADPIELTELDWSLSRPALDGHGRLVRILELPAWRRSDAQRLGAQASDFSARLVPTDAAPAPQALVGHGIEAGGVAYRTTSSGLCIGWQYSASLNRLCGRLRVSQGPAAHCSRFAQYLLYLNCDLRFLRIGWSGSDIALQAVLPGHDRRWVELTEGAFAALCDVLRSQSSWWCQPRWLVDDLLRQVDRGPENERTSI